MIDKIQFTYNGKSYQADLSRPIDLSIPLQDGYSNPNCYYAEAPSFETIRMGSFIGEVSLGGVVNHKKITLTPHGNGTHTECIGHISADQSLTIGNFNADTFHLAKLISVQLVSEAGDQLVKLDSVLSLISQGEQDALIIRTIPNGPFKLTRQYSGSNPPYLENGIGEAIRNKGIKHLIIDLPSVDKEVDEGMLNNHKGFWNIASFKKNNGTITELAYVPDAVPDGFYLLNLQTINLALDACPSRPLIFHLL